MVEEMEVEWAREKLNVRSSSLCRLEQTLFAQLSHFRDYPFFASYFSPLICLALPLYDSVSPLTFDLQKIAFIDEELIAAGRLSQVCSFSLISRFSLLLLIRQLQRLSQDVSDTAEHAVFPLLFKIPPPCSFILNKIFRYRHDSYAYFKATNDHLGSSCKSLALLFLRF